LNGKKVLFIAPRFFGYEREIKSALERRGATVEWLRDRPLDTPLALAVLRIFPRAMLAWADRYYRKRIQSMDVSKFDIVFAMNPITLTPKIVKLIRELNPSARYVIYMWDSMENRAHLRHILEFFDLKWCFDPDTAAQFAMGYRPLFYLKDYAASSVGGGVVDVSFVGSIHTDRYAVISKVRGRIPAGLNCAFYLYLPARWIFWVQKVLRPSMWKAKFREFIFQPIPSARVVEIFKQSKVILDIEHPKQRGLTMRTLETLGAGKKLITTNPRVASYDFYDPDNVAIIDRRDPRIPERFWSTPYRAPAPEVRERYSIDGWVEEIFALRGA